MRCLVFLLVLAGPLAAQGQDAYARHSQGRIALYEVSGRFVVETGGSPAPDVSGFEMVEALTLPNHFVYQAGRASDLCGRPLKMALLEAVPSIVRVHPDYRMGPGEDAGRHTIVNTITVVFAFGTPGVEARAILERYGADVTRYDRDIDPNARERYRLRLRPESPYSVLEAANALNDEPGVRWAHADAYVTIVRG